MRSNGFTEMPAALYARTSSSRFFNASRKTISSVLPASSLFMVSARPRRTTLLKSSLSITAFFITYINTHHLVGILHHRRCGNFNREVRRDGGDKILRGFCLRVEMALINNQNDCPPSFACAFNNA